MSKESNLSAVPKKRESYLTTKDCEERLYVGIVAYLHGLRDVVGEPDIDGDVTISKQYLRALLTPPLTVAEALYCDLSRPRDDDEEEGGGDE